MEWIMSSEIWIALLSLTLLEIVLGVDNIVFISILSESLPEKQRPFARKLGLALAMGMRIALLFCISWVLSLEKTVLFTVVENQFTGKDLILLGGGLFLLAKATYEIHEKLEAPAEGGPYDKKSTATFGGVIFQIVLLDSVFSIDSVITAVGMTNYLGVMIAAVLISISIMMVSIGPISRFVKNHPTIKILALSFLLLIGMTLVAEGLGQHISKGYIYFAMGFSMFVELINLQVRGRKRPVEFKQPPPDKVSGTAE